jgi:hypothetical protein
MSWRRLYSLSAALAARFALRFAIQPMEIRVVTGGDIVSRIYPHFLLTVVIAQESSVNVSTCSVAGLAYLKDKANVHWRWGLKAGSNEPAFFTSISYSHDQKKSHSSVLTQDTIRGPGWGGVVVTHVDSPSANCEFDSRPHLRSTSSS